MAITKAEARKAEQIRQRHLKTAQEVKERTRAMKEAAKKDREIEVTWTDAAGREEKSQGSGPQVSVVAPPDPADDPSAVDLGVKVPEELARQLAHRAHAVGVPLGTLVASILRENVNAPYAMPSIGRSV